MLKKFTAMAASLLLAVNGLALFPCSTAHAEDEEKGYWKKFSETNLCPAPDIRSTSYIWSIDAEDSEWKYHESTEVLEHPSSGGYDTFGFKMDHYINVTPLADTYRPGDVVELDVDYHFATNIPITVIGQVTGGLGTVHDKEMAMDAWQTAEVWLAQDDRTNQFGLTCAASYTSVGNFESETKKFETDVGTSTRNVDGNGTVSITVQKHSSSDVLAIGLNMRVGSGGGNCSTVSLYKWVSEENKLVVKPVPEEKGYWHLNSVKDYGGGTGDNPVKTQHFKSEGGSGYYHANAHQNGSETVYGHECRGEWTDHVLTVYSPLKDKYYAGDTASVGLSYVTNTNIAGEAMKSHGAVYMIDMTLWGYYQEHPDDAEAILDLTHYTGDIEFTDENGKRGFSPEIIEDDSGRYNKVTSGTWLSAKMPEGRKNGEKLYIDHCFSPYGAPGIVTVYEYEWITIQEEAELGDVNGDSVINAKDASEVLIAAAKIGTGNSSGLAPELEKVADVNSDGSINAKDATSILRYAAAVGTGVKASIKDYI